MDKNINEKIHIIQNNNDINFNKKLKNKIKTAYEDKYNNIVIVTEGKSETEYIKNIFTKNLNYYMNKKGKNKTELSNDLKLKYSTVRDWCNGVNYPRPEKIEILANYFDISRSDLTEEKTQNKIPVLGRIPAGIPIEAIEEILDYEEVPKDWFNGDKQYFALKIDGDSMSPRYETRRYCYI